MSNLFERQNGYIADTPGFSALDFDHIDKDEIKYYFSSIDMVKHVSLGIVIISRNLIVMLSIN